MQPIIMLLFLIGGDQSWSANMLAANNHLRVDVLHSAPQSLSDKLSKAAENQAIYMAMTGDFEHYGSNGTPGTRAALYHYNGVVKENLAKGFRNIADVFEGWRNSPTHWKAIQADYDEVGFGRAEAADGTIYWVALYGKSNEDEKQQKAKQDEDKTNLEFMLISVVWSN